VITYLILLKLLWENQKGELHRLNGPAKIVPVKRTAESIFGNDKYEYNDLHMEWWINGTFIGDNENDESHRNYTALNHFHLFHLFPPFCFF